MTLKCYLLSLLRMHRLDCERCKASEKGGVEMRERLDELNSEPKGIFAEVIEPFDLEPSQTAGDPSVSLPQEGKKAG